MSEQAPRPPIATAPLSLVLIARNTGADLEKIVVAWIAQLEARQRPWQLILVDDGSTDDTPLRSDILASRYNTLRVIHHPAQTGFGTALSSGIALAQHPLLAYATCDRQYEPADLKLFLEQIDKVDLVTGCRQWLTVPAFRRVVGRIWRILVRVIFGIPLEPLPCWLGDHGQGKRWLARWFFGVRVHDVECAFRLARRSIFARMPIQSSGPFAQVEVLAKANFLGSWMAEVPVTYHPPAGPLLHGSSNQAGYLSEAYQVLSNPIFGNVR